MNKISRFASLAFAVSTVTTIAIAQPPVTLAAESASKHVMFILDASNSMWGQIGGKAKIQIAKEVLKSQVAALPGGTRAGLIAYGHRFARELNDCEDMELVSGYSLDSPKLVDEALDYVVPKGQTPIARTLEESIDWVKGPIHDKPVTNPTVVLITDGAESCNGDPCAAAKKLADAGINTKIHVVGFGLNEQQRGQVQCIAENGNGKYFDATDAAGLNDALKQVEVEMAQATPEPAAPVPAAAPAPEVPPAPVSFFLDEFDGTGLSGAWQVKNANNDAYIVENGELLLVAGSAKSGFDVGNTPNIIQLGQELPDGDWRLSALVKAQYQTVAESLWFGVYKDEGNFIAANLYTKGNPFYGWQLVLRIVKASGGTLTQFEKEVRKMPCQTCKSDKMFPNFAETIAMPMELSLIKRGRQYSASVALAGENDKSGQQLIHETEQLASLRVPGGLALAGGQNSNVKGETLFYVDKVEIHSLK